MKYLIFSIMSLFSAASLLSDYPKSENYEFYKTVDLARNNPEKWPAVAYAVKLQRLDVVEFLLNQGEDINSETCGKKLYEDFERNEDSYSSYIPKWTNDDWNKYRVRGIDPGYTPLELAVIAQNVEMVRFLCAKGANPMVIHRRVSTLYILNNKFLDGYLLYEEYGGKWQYQDESALSEAIKGGNEKIIEMIIQAYTEVEHLYQEYDRIRKSENPLIMRIWIEKLNTLPSGAVSEDIVTLFMSTTVEQAIQRQDLNSLEQLIAYGLKITEKEFDLALKEENYDIILYLMSNRSMFNSFDLYEKLISHGFDDIVKDHISDMAYPAFAKHNRADLLKLGFECGFEASGQHLFIAIENGSGNAVELLCMHMIPIDGALIHAVKHNQEYIVSLLLAFEISQNELLEAHALAYEIGAYDLFDLIDKHISCKK